VRGVFVNKQRYPWLVEKTLNLNIRVCVSREPDVMCVMCVCVSREPGEVCESGTW
jgi:hypothetical protein